MAMAPRPSGPSPRLVPRCPLERGFHQGIKDFAPRGAWPSPEAGTAGHPTGNHPRKAPRAPWHRLGIEEAAGVRGGEYFPARHRPCEHPLVVTSLRSTRLAGFVLLGL